MSIQPFVVGRRPDRVPELQPVPRGQMGIEGFVEAVAQEVAPFGIEFTLVEPGPTRTNFGAGLVSPPPIAAYENTPSGEMRRALATGSFTVRAEAANVVRAMIDSVSVTPAPRRLLTSGASYERIHRALMGRLTALEAQKEIAYSTDVDA